MSRFGRGNPDDLWKATLEQIPTLLGRLYYLASIRDDHSGEYRHHGLASMHGEAAADQTIRSSHERAFAEWLRLTLPFKKEDLDEYLAGIEDPPERVLATWAQTKGYLRCVPGNAPALERELFLTDLETLLEVVRNGLGVAAPDPDS